MATDSCKSCLTIYKKTQTFIIPPVPLSFLPTVPLPFFPLIVSLPFRQSHLPSPFQKSLFLCPLEQYYLTLLPFISPTLLLPSKKSHLFSSLRSSLVASPLEQSHFPPPLQLSRSIYPSDNLTSSLSPFLPLSSTTSYFP